MSYRSVLRRPGCVPGGLLIACIVLAPLIVPSGPTAVAPADQFLPPSTLHWLGTDHFGRDVLSRVLWGGRTSLVGAMTATLLAATLGTLLGAGAAGFGGHVDGILMRLVDVLMAFPGLLVAMLFVAAVGPGLWPAMLGTGIALAPGFSRLIRASLLSLREQPFVEAARVLGASRVYIVWKHFIPNILIEAIGYGSVIFAWSLLNITGLEFLGLAGPPDSLSWGRMLYDGRNYLSLAPWIALTAGSAIVVTTLFVIQVSEMLISNRRLT
jgi:peptide/nickel transport system permease protein